MGDKMHLRLSAQSRALSRYYRVEVDRSGLYIGTNKVEHF